MTLTYKIQFFDYWHLGSGLSAGAKFDSSVSKDSDKMPFVPAKTIKGLVREMADEFDYPCDFFDRCFGSTSKKEDKCYKEKEELKFGECYFKNATLDKTTHSEIKTNKLQNNLYDVIASTRIKDGIAVDDSLREIEVVIPMTLGGDILDIANQEDYNKLVKCLKLIKRMGLNRNRGLGRCEFKEIECKN
jgi:hypothetical protein